jgi:phenylpropionate dioxygenase-like ring-hydroxylating dioxygenase large terminal subunit
MTVSLKDIKAIPLARTSRDAAGGTPTAKAPDPDLGYRLIPKERYIDKSFMDLEWQRLWTKVWLLGGREEVIPEAGDWMTHEVGTESFIFVRQPDGTIKGFFNVCRHRGNRLCVKDSVGYGTSFKCSYHHWEWNADGSLKNIPDQETFPQITDTTTLGLKPVKVDTWGGFFWFSMNPNVEPLRDYLGVIPSHLDPYHFERMKLIDWKTIEWDCNWKTSVDAFNETYHVQGIHPELMSWLDDWNVQIDCYGKHNRYLVPMISPSPRFHDQANPGFESRMFAQLAGVNPDDFVGRSRELRLAIQQAKRAMQDKFPYYTYPELNDDQLSDDYHYMIFPNVTMNIYSETMLLFVSRPHPTDPNKMFFDLLNFAHLAPGTPYQLPEHQTYKHGQISLGLVLDQDAANLGLVQEGMNSVAYDGLIVGQQELRIRHFHETLTDYVDPDRSLGV